MKRPVIQVLEHSVTGDEAYIYHLEEPRPPNRYCQSLNSLFKDVYETIFDDLVFRQKAPTVGPFLWLTHKGELLPLGEMATPHLFYALRMIYNHTAPEEFRTPPLSDSEVVKGIRRYCDVPHWSPTYCAAAVKAFSAELQERNPKGLLPGMVDQIRFMWIGSVAMIGLGIKGVIHE